MDESHFIDMMRAIEPHVSGRPKRSVELMLQSADLMRCLQQYREPELAACDTSQDFIDFEALLTDLQRVCNSAEADFINLILNFFRSQKIYSAYRMASHSGQPIQETSVIQASAKDTPQEAAFDTAQTDVNAQEAPPPQKASANFLNLMENPAIQSLLSPAQKENLTQIGTLMQAMS